MSAAVLALAFGCGTPVSIVYPADVWTVSACVTDRTTRNLSACLARSVQSSASRTPGTFVSMGLNSTANLGRRVGLGVEGVVLRRPAGEEQHEAPLRPTE